MILENKRLLIHRCGRKIVTYTVTQLVDIIYFERSALYCGLFQVTKNPLPYEPFFFAPFCLL